MVRAIVTKKELIKLAKELEVRHDWHEPDEQGVTVVVRGKSFDNACGGWTGEWDDEKYVEIRQGGKVKAVINLATLFAFATGTYAGENMG